VTVFLSECDLVKFAKLEPTPEQCEKILEFGVGIVRSTMPSMAQRTRAAQTTQNAPKPPPMTTAREEVDALDADDDAGPGGEA